MSRNLLDQETSPYLLAHKENPVHWRPWGPEALAEAQDAGKPILLSIGYTACHWCHVMNHESFEDGETAELMNELFVNVKVDREERPDLDLLYQTAANNMGHAGGWPLTMFLTPKGEPYFVGGYFPKEERFGTPPFKKVLADIAQVHREQQDNVASNAARIQDALNQLWASDRRGPLDPSALDAAAVHIGQRFDIFYGGATGAPKFPAPHLTEVLWRAYLRTGVEQFSQLVQATMHNICQGGIYDHVGGGIARYATDDRWLVPHFEKMLYDQAEIVDMLTLVWQHNRWPLYADRVAETIGFVLRELRVEAGFAASLDADSEGEEGKYYLWTEAEVDAALKGTFAQRFKEVYNVTRDGNFNGKNILHRLGVVQGYPLGEADEALFKKQRSLLLAARQKRVAPLRDDKVVTDWNGMMIAALANAGAVFRNEDWTAAAVAAFDFVCEALGDGDRLFHSWRGKRGKGSFADDYAQMIRAALTLWETTGQKRYLERAKGWTRQLNEHFWDMQNGGYFTTSDEADPLIVRPRMVFDRVTPSANGTMVAMLAKLFIVTADQSYRDRANALLQAFSGEVGRAAISLPTYLNSFETALSGLQIVIVGQHGNPKTQSLIQAVLGRSLPAKTLMLVEPNEALPEGHPARGKGMENGQPTAYLCQNGTCSQPTVNPVALSQALLLPPQLAAQARAQAQAQAQAQMQAQNQPRN